MIYLEQARGRSQREGHHAKGTARRGTGNPAGQGRPKVGADGQPATTQAETDRSKCESCPGAQGQQQQSNGSRRKSGRNGNSPTPKATGWGHPTTTDRNRYEGHTLPDGGRGENPRGTPTGAVRGQPPGHYGLTAAWPRCQGRNEVESAAALDQWGWRDSLFRRWPGPHGMTYLPRAFCLSRGAADGSEEAARLPWTSGGQRGWLQREITGPRLGQSRGCPNETGS